MSAVRRLVLLLAVPGALAGCEHFKESSGTGPGSSEAGNEAGPGTDEGGPDEAGPPACDGSTSGIETVLTDLSQAGTIAVDDTNVYVEDQGTTTGVVYQCPKTGCSAPTTLGPGYATGIAIDAHYVYWNDFSGGDIVRCAIGGCATSPPSSRPTSPMPRGSRSTGPTSTGRRRETSSPVRRPGARRRRSWRPTRAARSRGRARRRRSSTGSRRGRC